MQISKATIQQKAFTLAHQIKGNYTNWSKALKAAYIIVKSNTVEIIRFRKVKGGESGKRVICRKITDFITVKGTGKESPAGLEKAVDLAKYILGNTYSTVISWYDSKIISLAV